MELDLWVWAAFGVFVVAMLALDLVAFGRRGEAIPFRRALAWSAGWTALGLAFAVLLAAWQGRAPAEEYLAGFLIEKSLSIDNLFVFALIFAYFGVPAAYQRRVIFWGIVGAVVLRGVFILAGAALLDAFHITIYVFGAFLVATGIRMARHAQVEVHPERNPALRLLGRLLPLTTRFHGDRLTVRVGSRRVATPLAAALVLVATFDVVFAVDSIPAIFAITRDTFIVYAANAFSLLGLSSLYFLLAGLMGRFRYLNQGLAAILVFVGLKMGLSDVYEVPVPLSLAVVVLVLAAAVGASLLRPLAEGERTDAGVRPGPGAPAPGAARPLPEERGAS
ncbi:MAG TPA: TerC family protein [Gaiellaceae bacterium]|jgi:tellurite resistance protein TerC|nr:TerC family protein [Gaiellaceae bacterium]